MIGTSFLGALLFLGGWLGPGPAWLGPLWFLLKAMFVFLVVTWVRWSFVRIRVDQILAISWKLLLPASLVLLLATAFVVACRAPVPPEPASFCGETWQLVRAVGRAMGVTLRNLFRRPVTVQYPTVKRVYPDRFRGILALVYEKDTGEEACIGCRLCESSVRRR